MRNPFFKNIKHLQTKKIVVNEDELPLVIHDSSINSGTQGGVNAGTLPLDGLGDFTDTSIFAYVSGSGKWVFDCDVHFSGTTNVSGAGGGDVTTAELNAVSSSIASDINNKAPLIPRYVNFIAASKGLTYPTDAQTVHICDRGSAQTIFIPTNASQSFPVGTAIVFIQVGSGQLTLTGNSGVTVNGVSAGSVSTSAQFSPLSAYKYTANEWVVYGDKA